MFDHMNTQRMPSMRAVAREQLRLLIGNSYVPGLFCFMLLYLVSLFVFIPHADLVPWEGPRLRYFYFLLIVIGAIAGGVVWFGEGPRNRRYHWSMPVRRELHDLIRIAAGAVWLMALIAIYCLLYWLGDGPVMRSQWLNHAPLFWIAQFLVPLLAYLLFCIPCIVLGRPIFVILIALALPLFLSIKPVREHAPSLWAVGDALFSYRQSQSLTAALSGGEQSAPWHKRDEIWRVYWATSENWFAQSGEPASVKQKWDTYMGRSSSSGSIRDNYTRPIDAREWLVSLAAWYVIALLGIALALRRRPDV
jgi:hypothetical protein